jgi:cyclophilin family peptidyl-prolyl cis-trans isomerase
MVRKAAINTDYGTITIELYEDLMPISCKRFIELANKGEYNKGNMVWHRVEDWVIQTGEGINGYSSIKLEINKAKHHNKGAVGLARTQVRDSAQAQFYIVKRDSLFLDRDYAMFGMTVGGMEILDKIKPNDRVVSVKMVG